MDHWLLDELINDDCHCCENNDYMLITSTKSIPFEMTIKRKGKGEIAEIGTMRSTTFDL